MDHKTLNNRDTENTVSETVTLENNQLMVSILPGMGAKITSILRKSSGTQFLKESESDLQNVTKPNLGDLFLPPHASGFDDCFPNVSPSKYLFNGSEIALPDHGELWTRSWNYEQKGREIILWTGSELLDYRFAKHIQLVGSRIEITYELENMEGRRFEYMWSSHPLLHIHPGDELLLPDEISDVRLNWSSDPSLGNFGDKLSWPNLYEDKSDTNFRTVQEKSMEFAVKVFSDKLTKGKAGIYKKQTDESLSFSFDVEQVPFMGIWLCYGGWPDDYPQKDYTLGLEPCSGRPDSLKKACKWGDQQQIAPSTIKCWQLGIEISEGRTSI